MSNLLVTIAQRPLISKCKPIVLDHYKSIYIVSNLLSFNLVYLEIAILVFLGKVHHKILQNVNVQFKFSVGLVVFISENLIIKKI